MNTKIYLQMKTVLNFFLSFFNTVKMQKNNEKSQSQYQH